MSLNRDYEHHRTPPYFSGDSFLSAPLKVSESIRPGVWRLTVKDESLYNTLRDYCNLLPDTKEAPLWLEPKPSGWHLSSPIAFGKLTEFYKVDHLLEFMHEVLKDKIKLSANVQLVPDEPCITRDKPWVCISWELA